MSKTIYITIEALRMALNKDYNMKLPKDTKFVLTSELDNEREQNYVSDLEARIDCLKNGIIDDETLKTLIKEHQMYKDLEAKLAEHNEYFNALGCENFNEFKDFISTFMLTPHEEQLLIQELKQQLAEKEKELNKRIFNSNYTDDDMVWFAIEQLEKVKEDILNYEDIYYQFLESGSKVPVFCVENYRVRQPIDNQIEELKKEMK